mgnify:CR=1 FL=1
MIREMARLTKPGGRIIVVEWRAEDTPIGPPLDHRLSIEQSKSICESEYLEFLDEIEVGHSHYGLMYERTPASYAPRAPPPERTSALWVEDFILFTRVVSGPVV